MQIQHIAAFTRNGTGGNPAGVVIADTLPSSARMPVARAAFCLACEVTERCAATVLSGTRAAAASTTC